MVVDNKQLTQFGNMALKGKRVKGSDKIPMNLDLAVLTLMAKYTLSESVLIKRNMLNKLSQFVSVVDTTLFSSDPAKVNLYNFTKLALNARMILHLEKRDLIFSYVQSRFTNKIDFIDINNCDLSKADIAYLNKVVSESLKYGFVYSNIDKIREMCARFEATDYQYRGNIVNEFENLLNDVRNDFRRVTVEDINDQTFSLEEEAFENIVTDTYNIVTSPNRRLYTGMQGFNQMTGGFENGRVYMLFGLGGIGKSIFLLNLIYQMKLCNPQYIQKDPTKMPCIVLLTMENTMVETITRLFNLTCSDNVDMDRYKSAEEVIKKFREEGQLILSDSNKINIIIKYRPNHSVDTNFLYTLVDDLSDAGYETIAFFQDHVKRIHSAEKENDLRLELGNIVNEFKTFAATYDIPVISVGHLNRDASKVVQDADVHNKADATRLLGKSNVGESFLMLENLDCGILLNKEYDSEGHLYMVMSTVKMRDKERRTYIAQPFVAGSTIRLVIDINSPMPAFRESLVPDVGLEGSQTVHPSSYFYNNDQIGLSKNPSLADVFSEDKKNVEDDNTFLKVEKPVVLNSDMSEPETELICPVNFIDGINPMEDNRSNDVSGILNMLESNNDLVSPVRFNLSDEEINLINKNYKIA